MFQRQWQRKICKVIVGLNVECWWKKTEVSSKVRLASTNNTEVAIRRKIAFNPNESNNGSCFT